MARTPPRPAPPRMQRVQPMVRHGPGGGAPLWAASHHSRPSTTLEALIRLPLQRRRCRHPACPQGRNPYRPAAAGRLALPMPAWGLAGLACMGPPRAAPPPVFPRASRRWSRVVALSRPGRAPIAGRAMPHWARAPGKTRPGGA
jgi:hypothetical protein